MELQCPSWDYKEKFSKVVPCCCFFFALLSFQWVAEKKPPQGSGHYWFPISHISTSASCFQDLPHLAGTEQNLLLAKTIQSQWKKFGLDSAELVHYDVLLSYPNETDASYISVMDEHGIEIFNTSYVEPPPDGYENVKNIVPPYNAFSPPGVPEGELVYVNYARTEDFFKLEREMNINCTGKIVIARYGKIFRGNK
ncbi:hypothetical protein FD754_024496, partial [Muntiacus muntjak]